MQTDDGILLFSVREKQMALERRMNMANARKQQGRK
jgi:hypothetical protein